MPKAIRCIRRTVMLGALTLGGFAGRAPGQTVVIDNVDPGFAVLSGTWSTASSVAGHYGLDYRYTAATGGPATAEVEWRPTLSAAGVYDVAVYYPASASRPNNATYRIHQPGAADQFAVVNQQISGGVWVSLGQYTFPVGSAGYVALGNTGSGGNVIADAVRFLYVADPPTFIDQALPLFAGLAVDARSASLADIDNDGDLDLFFQGASGAIRLLRNLRVDSGSLGFLDITSQLGGGLGPSWSACWGDYDGDGDVDVFVGQSNLSDTGDVLRNDGVAGFTNASAATGLDDPGFHQNVAWSDIDNDDDLDLLIAMEGPEPHEIYLQGPAGQFTAVGLAVGFQEPEGIKAYGMAIGDTDGDGDRDVYISTCRGDNNIRNNFYENRLVETGVLAFVDIADVNGTQNLLNSYHAEFTDLDDDGDLDLFVVGSDAQPTKIFRNDGANQFTDVETILGHPLLDNAGGDYNGGRAIDYDNDGDLDLFLHDHLAANGQLQARKLYRCDGAWQYTDVTVEAGLHHPTEGAYDSAWGDLDLDGDLDLVAATDLNSPERIFICSANANGNHWAHVRLAGSGPNTTGIGAALYATLHHGTPDMRTLRRDANSNAGTFNQSDLPVHFGLGAAERIDQLRVVWPDGAEQFLCDVPADVYLTVHAPMAGDFDGNGVLDLTDAAAFADCLGGPDAPADPASLACVDACRNAFDADGDGDVDLADWRVWQQSAGSP